MIYLAECSGLYKIGYSKHPVIRVRELQATNANKLTLIGQWPGELFHEQSIHRRFEHCRQHGEWFAFSEKDLKDFHAYLPRRRSKRGRPRPAYGPYFCLMCARKARFNIKADEFSCECGWKGKLGI